MITNTKKTSSWVYIAVWISLGYSMILFNKLILSTWDFPYPFFLICWHSIFATVLTQILSRTTNLLPGVKEGRVTVTDYLTRIMPMAICAGLSLVLGNMVYRYLSLGYIQMLKAVMPVPLLLMHFMAGREKPSFLQLCIVLQVSFGVMLSSIGELRFNWFGFIIQCCAVTFDCGRVFLIDVALKDLSLDSLSLLYYSAPSLSISIGFGFFIFEYSTFPTERLTASFIFIIFISGCLAFILNLAVLILVTNTDSLVMTLAGPIKDICIIITSVIVFESPISSLQIIGFSTTLLGLKFYRDFKTDPMKMLSDIMRIKDTIIKILCHNSIINVIKLDSKDSDEESSVHENEREMLISNNDNNKEENN